MKKWTAALVAALSAFAGGVLVKRVWLEKYRQQKKELAAVSQERDLLYTWLLLKQKNVDVAEYFTAHGYKTIGIMGMNREGWRFYDALMGKESVEAVYAVEMDNFGAVHERLTVYRLGNDLLPPADCIVICDLMDIPEKEGAVRKEFKGEIVMLSEVLSWLIEEYQIKPWDGALKDWP